MKIIAIILIILLSWCASSSEAACTKPSDTWVTTPDQSSVQSCVNRARNGDVISLLAGTETWTSSVDIPPGKALTIHGAGISQTIIGTSAGDSYVFKIASDNTRITNAEFNCSTVWVQQVQDFRIDHNKFTCPTRKKNGVYVQGSGNGPASPRGLIDNNDFNNMRVVVNPHPKVSVAELRGSNHWTRGAEHGTGEGVYIEDNTFIVLSPSSGNSVDCQYSARYVARFNHVTDAMFEVHSAQGMARGCRGGEIYYNTMVDAPGGVHPFYIFFIRGGS